VLALPFAPLFVWREMSSAPIGEPATASAVLFPPLATVHAWRALAFILVFPTAVAYLLNTLALARLRASTTAVYVYLQPVITGLFGWWMLDEQPTPALFASAAVIFAGIWLVARAPRARRALEPGSAGT